MKSNISSCGGGVRYFLDCSWRNRVLLQIYKVMVWIHSGGFIVGSASTYDGSALAAYQEEVVVLSQYQLGVLGFLSTGDEHLSGNFGLLDQIQALRWVKEHIHNFGGNTYLVTIFGESAGSITVSLLLLSPLSDGLFHRAIAESATAAVDVLMNDPVLVMQPVGNTSGCSHKSTEKIAKCMRNLDSDTLLALGNESFLRYPVHIDGHLLTKPVPELLQKHELLTVPFMTGVNNHEGGFIVGDHFGPPNWTEGMDREQVANMVSMFYPFAQDAAIRDLTVMKYVESGEHRMRNRDGFSEFIGDFVFTIPAIKVANAYREK
ncbi:hypothetical protein ILYODFUR_001125 [Ilyodon furcidens]|uniref:Carboxylic ester hydrolase n=1 Tax=Ilyodon furcidens TaxID=33524 RepID=A0ABV0TF28_9TELE